ncbi:MAG: hypothetical protein U0V04_00810 [Spirosomataceae bacterium]
MNYKLENYSDRELLELIISNQVNIAQRVFRINDYFLEKYGKEFIDKIEHKDQTFLKLIEESRHLIQQLGAIK